MLQSKNVSHVALVTVCPEMLVGTSINQLCGNAYPVACSQYCSLDHRVHATEFARNFREREFRSFVSFNRCMRDYPQAAGLGQISDQLIGHAIAEILLVGIIGKVAEGEDGKGSNLMCARSAKPWRAEIPNQSENRDEEDGGGDINGFAPRTSRIPGLDRRSRLRRP